MSRGLFTLAALAEASRHLIRRNAVTLRRVSQLQSRENCAPELHRKLQAALLHNSLRVAKARLSRYRDLPALPAGQEIFEWAQIHLPIIVKEDLIEHRREFYPNSGRRRLWWPAGRTSGTSGTPLEIFRSIDSVLWEEAFQLQSWSWTGYSLGQPQAVLRGDQIIKQSQKLPPFWSSSSLSRQLTLSTRHLSEGTASVFLNAIAESGAVILRAYPSAAVQLARWAEALSTRPGLRAVITGSEPLYSWQRELLEAVFECKVFDFYGMAERVAFAAQCEYSHHHLHPEYSWVQIVDDQGKETDGFGSIVGTTFWNRVMPLLRYRVSDFARWIAGDCPCGRTYPRIELSSGKVEDQLYDPVGVPVSPSIITFAFKGLKDIRKSQVAQVDRVTWEVRVVPAPGFTQRHTDDLVRNLAGSVSEQISIRIRVMDDIPLLPSGKFKWVSQEWLGAHELGLAKESKESI
jgi:phenylacetate-CoA ligase